MNKKELRNNLISEMKAMDETAKKENRSFTDEERKAFDEKNAEVQKITAEIAEEEARAKTLEEFSGLKADEPKPTEEKRSGDFLKVVRSAKGVELRTAMTQADGGAAIAPEQFVNDLEREVIKQTLVYPRVKKIPVTGAGSLGLPYEAADVSDAAWTAEVPSSDITEDTTWKFGKRNLAPSDLTKLIKVSKKLLATSALPIDTLAQERLSERFAAAYENGILNGTGSGQPLGIFVADANGISTARDVTTATAGTITGDDIMNVYMNLRPAYRKGACWIMNTQTLKAVMQLKDANGQYLWHESLRVGEPSTLLGLPVLESEFAPTGSGASGAFASGDYALVLGDLSHYQFAYWKGLEVTVANEVFAGTNQVGFYGHSLADGCPTLEAAFSRLVIA